MVDNGNTVISDQKKRALEALERRSISAKPDLLRQQRKNVKRSLGTTEGDGDKNVSTCPAEEDDKLNTPVSKRGQFASSGHTPTRGTPGVADAEANHPAYFQICQPIHEKLWKTDVEISSRKGNAADRIVHELLQHGDYAQKYMQGSRSMKFDSWLLLDSFVQGRGASSVSRTRASESNSKRSRSHMSMKQHRKYGSFNLPGEFHKFEIFKPMHEMWKDYIKQLTKNVGSNQLAQCLLTADLHGAILQVVECKTTELTGASGIMVRETAETFGIVSTEDKFRVVPKRGSVFIFQADCWKITIHGDKFTSRNITI